MLESTKRIFYILLGFFFMALGFIGIFVPVLPTVPFLLLAAFFFMRSSERMYAYLINHSRFGTVISSFMENRSIPRKSRQKALILLWVSLIISMAVTADIRAALILLFVGVCVTVYLLRLQITESF